MRSAKKQDEEQVRKAFTIFGLVLCAAARCPRTLSVTVKNIARWILPRNAGSIDFPKLASPMIAACELEQAAVYESLLGCEACQESTVRVDDTKAACLSLSLPPKEQLTPTIPWKWKQYQLRVWAWICLHTAQPCFFCHVLSFKNKTWSSARHFGEW